MHDLGTDGKGDGARLEGLCGAGFGWGRVNPTSEGVGAAGRLRPDGRELR